MNVVSRLEGEMSTETDRDYYLRRAAEEAIAAEQAENGVGAAIHRELARTYRERAARPADRPGRDQSACQQQEANG